MVQLSSTLLIALSAVAVHGLPFFKRIDQTIADSTTQWVAACNAAGGGSQCSTLSVNAFETLLIGAGVCDQQNAADSMITLAKQLNNNANMISLAQIFAQQPRNTPTSQAVPYCQQAPNNTELNGYYQCQFSGANQQVFVGNLQVGAAGTIPFGLTTPVSPPGSCPANPSGPIADGDQLVNITTNPGTPATGSGQGNATASAASGSGSVTATATATTATATETESSECGGDDDDDGEETTTTAPTATAATSTATSSSSSSSFLLSNGQKAQQQNAQFSSLTSSTSCTAGTNACVNGDFAQCVDGAYVTTSCGSGLSCFALPLVNSAGTSITCATESDAASRIANTGATGGVTGSSS
ncbi:uncharacterized protein FIBRA_04105 [Fibroporia radiculosa]|uniref:Carbohydrate-binding module family 19 domain-containing protein n=1 Tax=Fibroporia radiculosa TaxID=599839 RepID=J4H2S4_9APHY|nr:uncharacterized protein FIBRA_04105 [Fibroporia radiculosa]CCM02029.1 predicted protein [Fibroporia radiculosa]